MTASSPIGPFLETRELLRTQRPEDATDQGDGDTGTVPAAALKLLEGSFPVAMPELLDRSGLSIGDFTDALDRLTKTNLITVDDDPERGQVVQLTEQAVALKSS